MTRAYGELFEKMSLLCSERNIIVKEALRQSRSNTASKKLGLKDLLELAYGVSPTALDNWLHDEKPKPEMLRKVIDSVQALFALSADAPGSGVPLTEDDFSPSVSKYAFGAKLGLTWREVQTIVDKQLFAHNSHPRVFTLSRDEASELDRRFEGLYFAYHFTPSFNDPTKPALARSALRVRHVIDIRRDRMAVVVCKLHIPAAPELSPDAGQYFPYLGLMKGGRRHRNVYWSFDEYSKDQSRRDLDMVSIFASPMELDQKLVGTLTSVGTGGDVYSSGVMLDRVAIPAGQREDRDFYKKHMRHGIKLLSGAHEIHDLLRDRKDVAEVLVGRYFLSGTSRHRAHERRQGSGQSGA